MAANKRRSMVIAGLVVFVSAVVALTVGAQSGPTLKITAPKDGAHVMGDTVKITWEANGVKVVPAAEAKAKEEGHFHVLLDREDFKEGVPIPPGMEKEGIYHTGASSFELKDLKAGAHKVIVVLSYNNHAPWEPLVTATVTFHKM